MKVAGSDYVIGTNMLDSGQTATYDIRALRDNQVKDRDGNTIPIDATRGQFYWSIIQAESGPTQWYMIGRAEQMDQVKGMSSSYDCQNCCNIIVADYGITPTNVRAVSGDKVSFSVWEDDYDCNGNRVPADPPSLTVSWSSGDKNVAKMNGNVATAKSGGTVTINAQWNAYQTSPPLDPNCGPPLGPQDPNLPNPCACSNNPRHINVNATLVVKPKVNSISRERALIGIQVSESIQGTGFGTQANTSVQVSGSGITVSISSVVSAEIVAHFTIAENADPGNHSVTVTVRGQKSNSVTFFVQVPTRIMRDSIGGLVDQPGGCGATRTLNYTLLDQEGEPILSDDTLKETVSDYTGPEGLRPPPETSRQMSGGAVPDVVGYETGSPTCPPPFTASWTQTFSVIVGTKSYPLSTTNSISVGRDASGTKSVNVTITTP